MAGLPCLVVDDSTRFLESVRTLLEHDGLEIVGTALTAEEALERAAQLRPDVILVDIALGPDSGFELARRLAQDGSRYPGQVVLISTHGREDFAELIAVSPAVGFLSKSKLSGDAIRELLREQNGR
jgi:DNA-binding NarL/FixJ family response regulator